jgi:hypothetical protein
VNKENFMSAIEVFDIESGKCVGTVACPPDVIEAAAKVEAWLKEHRAIELHGVTLAEGND